MLTEANLKLYDSAVGRRDLSTGRLFIPNKETAFVEIETLMALLE